MHQEHTNKLQRLNARLQSIIGSSTSTAKANEAEKGNTIDEFKQFHQHQNTGYYELKSFADKMSKQNWEYSNKILRYQQKFNKFQLAFTESNIRIQQLTKQVKAFQSQHFKIALYQQTIKTKDMTIQTLNRKISDLLQQQRMFHKTFIRPKDVKVRNKVTENSLALEIECRQQIQMLGQELANNRTQNNSLKIRVKQLEKQMAFQQERIKNATLSAQLDLKMKDNQIQRLRQQVAIYQHKFKQILEQNSINTENQFLDTSKENRSNTSKGCKGKSSQSKVKKELFLLIDQEDQLFQDFPLKSCRNKCQQKLNRLYSPSQNFRRKIFESKSSQKFEKNKKQLLNFQGQAASGYISDQKAYVKQIFLNKKQQQQIEIKQGEKSQLQTQRTQKKGKQNIKRKCHKRTCSSNLQSKQNRQADKPFDLKVKVYRCDKSAKRSYH